MTESQFILDMEKKVLSGGEVTFDEALRLIETPRENYFQLYASANRIREAYCGDSVYLCGIVNAKSGACSENCSFCSQAAIHPTSIETYSLMDTEAMLKASHEAYHNGAKAFGIVTAWKGIKKGKVLDKICDTVRQIKAEGKVVPDLSLGIIDDPEVAIALAEAGAEEYNHNLETSRSFFKEICTTHDYDERVRTIQHVKNAGMRVCSGGIFGLGESPKQRVELAFEIKSLDVHNTPLNFYHHTDGNSVDITKVKEMEPLQALAIVSVFRFVLPGNILKIAGGREKILGDFQELMFMTGANSTMLGNYLTTKGRSSADDYALIARSGLKQAEEACCTPKFRKEAVLA